MRNCYSQPIFLNVLENPSQETPEGGLLIKLALRRASSSFCHSWIVLLSKVIDVDLFAMVVSGYALCSDRIVLLRFVSSDEFCCGRFSRACRTGKPHAAP